MLTLSSQCERFRTWALSMRLKEHLHNIAWISAGYIVASVFVSQLVVPLQNEILPEITSFAALIYPIHGIRVVAAWMFGWRSVPYLFIANLVMVIFYMYAAPDTPAMEMSVERLMSWTLSSVVAVAAIDLFKAAGMKIGKGFSEISEDTWKQLLFVGFVSSVISAVGQSLIFSGQIIPGHDLQLVISFLIGDTSGTFLCFVGLLFLFRGYRWLTQ